MLSTRGANKLMRDDDDLRIQYANDRSWSFLHVTLMRLRGILEHNTRNSSNAARVSSLISGRLPARSNPECMRCAPDQAPIDATPHWFNALRAMGPRHDRPGYRKGGD